MMLSKVEAGKKTGEQTGNNGKLLNEIEAISKALYLDKNNPSKTLISTPGVGTKSSGEKIQLSDPRLKLKYGVNDDPLLHKDNKKSFWNWKPLKAFSGIRNRKFNCCFSLQVHSIEGLPESFNDVSLCVHWKRRVGGLATRAAKVVEGTAEFEEKLMYTCSVYGSRNGPHHSAKYEAKHFLLYAALVRAPELDLGKHRLDLTRLLPLTLEELEEEKSSGKWTTSFKLSGKAKGAALNVSFGYTVVGENQNVSEEINMNQNNLSMVKPAIKHRPGDDRSSVRRVESLPNIKQQSSALSRSIEDIKDLHEVLPMSRSELARSVNKLYQKLDEGKLDLAIDQKPELEVFTEHLELIKPHSCSVSESTSKESVENENENGNGIGTENEFSVIEPGKELPTDEPVKPDELTSNAADVPVADCPEVTEIDSCVREAFEDVIKVDCQDEENGSHKDELVIHDGTEVDRQDEENGSHKDELVIHDCSSKEEDICSKDLLMKELESVLNRVSNLETEAYDSPEDEENDMELKMEYKRNRMEMSLNLDDAESVASEFLSMLGIEHSPFGLSSESEPESPRERLLKQFEKETLATGCSLFNYDMGDVEETECEYNAPTGSEWGNWSEDFDWSSVIQEAEEEHEMETQGLSKMRAKMLEDLETEALMREWGLNETTFLGSPPKSSGGFGSPIDMPPEEPVGLPPLGNGLGPFLQTRNGGFVRSMNPSLFSNAKSGGSLIMQVSSPVVVPAEMGSDIIDILQQLASVGIEKLSMQANKLMPLEDMTGKTMQQIAWEATPTLDEPESQWLLQHELEIRRDVSGRPKKEDKARSSGPRSNKFSSTSVGGDVGSEYVSLEDLAPLAMDKMEALSMEGLRIQSGMSDEEAPSNISVQSIGEISALQGRGGNFSGSLGLDGTAGLQLLDIKDSGNDVDGLMGLSLTLDEWMRLDSGEIGDVDQISERTSKILSAHHAAPLEMIRGGSSGEKRRGKESKRKCGLLGNNFTVALMVQLHDPIRNYEPVGSPMLALIQVERVFVPPKPKIYSTVSELRNNDEEDDESDSKVKVETKGEKVPEMEVIPQFRINEVHVAGLKTEPGKKKLWGNTKQQQSGSRWLLANGMGKGNKHPFFKSKTVMKSANPVTPATAKAQPGDTLWSISLRVFGTGAKWKELAELNPHIRNPNVIFPNETIRLH
ncbi:LysM domain-containing protein/NT-C2 domain-containing protein [Cephalotus follicularis]|uniref:LysM domain-containing protein/NT-C2 domain-containing protein n=1 Tax=Cephalotus follicularis TaxID=3775 RepID=A0A1Q3BY87_CEPFO|nr:LysM domain-containing protein/NT-C2 domain-containing protein [Cephalotus follicularis]